MIFSSLRFRPRASLAPLALVLLLGSVAGAWAQGQDDLKAADPPANAIWLGSLDLQQATQDYGQPNADKSVDGHPLTLNGVVYPHGFGTHANGAFAVDLKKSAIKFVSMVGVDDEKKGSGSVTFEVWVDGKKAFDSGVLHGGDTAKLASVDLTGASKMVLKVTDAGDGIDSDHADWAGAMIVLAPDAAEKPVAGTVPVEPPPPIIFPTPPQPAIHGPRVVGASPNKPFLFLIPATGTPPLTYSATDLPAGLNLDENTGIISGALQQPGRFTVQVKVTGADGNATRPLVIISGKNKLALTPQMGWNSWNVWAGAVSADRVRQAADAMVNSGLAAHGFQYVNIDDTWEGKERAADGQITTNEKFGDMKTLADYVHGKGLKLGIYSSPGPTTCGGYLGTYGHEQQDADTYANWGIDYLKYDWCSAGSKYPGDVKGQLDAYGKMGDALINAPRDIFYSLCQYGMANVWEWGPKVHANSWRTTGDINDSWGSLQGIAFSQNGHEKYAAPGHWNDPDMLVVGRVGWGNVHPSHLTPNEQILHISMWCLLSAPLLIGCDMTNMDDFTKALLSNDEVLDIDQDPLGKPAGRVSQDGETEVWARHLADGTMAVGLFNRGQADAPVTAHWTDLGLTGEQPVRDLWLHKDLPVANDTFTANVPAHGVVLVKIGKPGPIVIPDYNDTADTTQPQ